MAQNEMMIVMGKMREKRKERDRKKGDEEYKSKEQKG